MRENPRLEVIDLLTPNPLRTVNLSAAALFRKVSEGSCTLLLDEADTYLSPKVATQHEDLRGLVNAGHRRGAVAYRCVVEKGVKVEAFPAFAPVAIAAIGDLPDTILDRAVIIAMKRRRNDEAVEPFRARRAIPIGAAIRDQAAAWAATNTATLATFEPDMPEGITDRPADVWEALVMIGDSAGDEWSTRIRQAATLIEGERSDADVSLGVRLLVDIRTAFDGTPDTDRLSTVDLLQKLNEMDGAPWGDLRGKPLDARGLAWRLRRHKVKSSQLGGLNVKGYLRSDFHDAWARYLPSPMDPKQAKQEEHDGDLGAGQ
ncbi:MAG: DUF3631 domain-containing protein [Acidimicrobiia bacterium]|nr:DUF3631 domain-containing protein [Acidimicrobiia bacterium]